MFDNIGFGELLVIALFILIFFGPKKIPDIARTLGKAVREFRKAMQDVQSEIQSVTGIDLDSEINQPRTTAEVESNVDSLNELKFLKDETIGSDNSGEKKNSVVVRKPAQRKKTKRSRPAGKTKLKKK